MKRHGFVLPFSMILALVILTSLGLWYRQAVLQSFLAERLVLQRADYMECRSLLPGLREKLDSLSIQELETAADDFMEINIGGRKRWRIERSANQQGRIRFTFVKAGRNSESLVLVMPYERKEMSGFPPDLTTE